ncbi:hypothetical protein BCU93_13520 [Vibrio breoganii]|uniref:recombinase family protein n=1 Tax=Vibrio breoganii TaxID=553239 RepID=UPI000C84AE63|nr:recombinase family protein [Vibrio breoganii]PMG38561.1 hypothetical protein BCU93_13520 [Vibrio breoganii]
MANKTYLYTRVSREDLNESNQIHAVLERGYEFDEVRCDTVSGAKPALERPAFKALVQDEMKKGDTLIVFRIDRLGRDLEDIKRTVRILQERGIKTLSLDVEGFDISSIMGSFMVSLLGAFAEMERAKIAERTSIGIQRAKSEARAQGRKHGNETGVTPEEVAKLREDHTVIETAQLLGVSPSTVKRAYAKYLKTNPSPFK